MVSLASHVSILLCSVPFLNGLCCLGNPVLLYLQGRLQQLCDSLSAGIQQKTLAGRLRAHSTGEVSSSQHLSHSTTGKPNNKAPAGRLRVQKGLWLSTNYYLMAYLEKTLSFKLIWPCNMYRLRMVIACKQDFLFYQMGHPISCSLTSLICIDKFITGQFSERFLQNTCWKLFYMKISIFSRGAVFYVFKLDIHELVMSSWQV